MLHHYQRGQEAANGSSPEKGGGEGEGSGRDEPTAHRLSPSVTVTTCGALNLQKQHLDRILFS